jgi:hypothetical protein
MKIMFNIFKRYSFIFLTAEQIDNNNNQYRVYMNLSCFLIKYINNGDLLLSEHALGIPIINNNEKEIYECIKSDKFKDFIKSCMWSNFQIDWRLFTYLKKDFYIEFIKNIKIENENLIKNLELPINLKNNMINDKLIKVSKKKTSKIKTEIINEDKEIDEIEKIIDDELKDLKVSKNKTSKPNIIINDDSNKTKEKKVIKKIETS